VKGARISYSLVVLLRYARGLALFIVYCLTFAW